MKNTNYIFLAVVVILLGMYFFFSYREDDSLNLNYKEPDSVFFDASLVPANAIVVEVTVSEFKPETLRIKKGDTVFWINKTDDFIWPASDPHPTHTNYSSLSPNFDPELPLKQNEAWSFTFTKTGVWKYHDHLDPSKRGVIEVGE